MDIIACVAFIAYSVWGIRWGMRLVDGRWEWLEKPAHRAVKWGVAIVLGIALGMFGLVAHIVKLILVDLPAMLR